MTVKEIVYMVLDLAKANSSDDSYYNEDHIIFLLKKYRSFLIKKENDKQKAATDTAYDCEYQSISLELEKVAAIDGTDGSGGYYLRTKVQLPKIMEDFQPRVYPIDYFQGININYISRDKMRYVGSNKFLLNILYVALGNDMHLYCNSSNPQFLYLNKINVSAVFDDFDIAASYNDSTIDDVLNIEFPIREYLIPTLIELVVKELLGSVYNPVDLHNNASDDLSKVSVKSN